MQTSDQARTHPARPGNRRRTGPAQCPELAALEMASTMSVGMVVLMFLVIRRRRAGYGGAAHG